ncbi:hypothetical protein SAMN05444405_12150 [Bacteroides luti]|uniref:Uncharacterized protein n=1 Tax=Bacteroides luti TaxID=1297750 RepID=A0A1M5GLZ4_9BACE|nr:hypothetical protein [Bacteroides luti]SHG04765.1 hypothetical protein SAMN05444405_12150 [Bacteroides luti]
MNCSISLECLVIKKAYIFRRLQKDPEVFVGAEYQQYRGWSCNKSRMTKKELEKLLTTRLKGKLEILGNLAEKRYKNYLGNCGEVHAANKVLKQNDTIAINQLTFSNAYRPRTLQKINYCQNCLDTFNISN